MESVASGVAVFAFGYLLWPPGRVYWTAVSDAIGGTLTLVVVAGVAIAFGFLLRRATPIRPAAFAAGGLLAYLLGTVLIESTTTPDSPVHRYWYGFLLLATIVGHAGRELLDSVTDLLVDALDLSARR